MAWAQLLLAVKSDVQNRGGEAAKRESPIVAVILPAYNEDATISQVIEEFARELPDATIVVIDNNSSDATAAIARRTLADANISGLVISETRQGKGHAVRRAFAEVDADIFVLCDADLTYPALRVHDLIEPVLANRADMVVADRISEGHYQQKNRRAFHSFGNDLVRWLVNVFFNAKLHDIMSGYRVMSRAFVKSYPILVDGFELETDMTLHALDKRYRIFECPVEYRERPSGSHSKLNTLSDGARVLFTITQLLRRYRPFFFFGTLAAVSAIAGVVVGASVLNDWLRFRYIYHVPSAILAAALEIVAVLCLGIGLILDAINYHFKMAFERTDLSEAIRRSNAGGSGR